MNWMKVEVDGWKGWKWKNVDEKICSATWLSDAVISPQSERSK